MSDRRPPDAVAEQAERDRETRRRLGLVRVVRGPDRSRIVAWRAFTAPADREQSATATGAGRG